MRILFAVQDLSAIQEHASSVKKQGIIVSKEMIVVLMSMENLPAAIMQNAVLIHLVLQHVQVTMTAVVLNLFALIMVKQKHVVRLDHFATTFGGHFAVMDLIALMVNVH
jgi:NADH:ubiquinone oxidoreductase subunit K